MYHIRINNTRRKNKIKKKIKKKGEGLRGTERTKGKIINRYNQQQQQQYRRR